MTQYGSLLSGSWKDILEGVSNIDKLFLIKAGGEDQLVSTGSKYMESETILASIVSNAEVLFKYVSISDIDRVFMKTSELDDNNLFSFITALCEISELEIKDRKLPRTFSMQKIIEVAQYNLFRYSKIFFF